MSDFKATIDEVKGGYVANITAGRDYSAYGQVIGKDLDELTENVVNYLSEHGHEVKVTGLVLGYE